MKALEFLRVQLVKDYPGDSPAYGKVIKSPEERKLLFDNLVIPTFEKITREFSPFHFEINIREFSFFTRLDIKDGCSFFSFAIKISRKFACATLMVTYQDDCICDYYENPVLLEEKYDLSKIFQDLPEELIISIFSEMFINRKKYLQTIVDTKKNIEKEKEKLIREERRAKLIALKHRNQECDPKDIFQEYLDSPEYTEMRNWIDNICRFDTNLY